ncbi:glutamate--tRNA ligase [Terricaulis sp.]|uniref:glutamate--tRNA ligase n=1 Tax=Terricaulis sp. TaxID=2768686 RepID=UPI0037839726
MSVVTRFAPSPTGFLHIGGARTALFNWLFAKKMGGKYLLRIEDTDRARSTDAAIAAIIEGLDWLGLDYDGQITFQFARAARHREAAEAMIARGTAFRCYVPMAELEARRARAEAIREQLKQLKANNPADAAAVTSLEAELIELTKTFRSPYRDGAPPPSPNAPFVVRLRAPEGDVVNDDMIQGVVTIKGADIDDLVLLRTDGNPTYMLSVVVDDHDMGVTHVIRGDDHLTNAARQIPIYQAMGWHVPRFAHVPLIHGEDGKKLSKRHGAQAVHEYRDMGYLPEALNAYLMRLGWSPGHDDILTKEEAVPLFDVAAIGKAPSRLDFKKLDSVNGHFMALADDARLGRLLAGEIQARGWIVSPTAQTRIAAAIPVLKKRAKTIKELADQARFLIAERPLAMDEVASKALKDDVRDRLRRLKDRLAAEPNWDHAALGATLKAFATDEGVGLGQIGPGLRAVLSGGAPAPDLGQALELLGREESLARLSDQV